MLIPMFQLSRYGFKFSWIKNLPRKLQHKKKEPTQNPRMIALLEGNLINKRKNITQFSLFADGYDKQSYHEYIHKL